MINIFDLILNGSKVPKERQELFNNKLAIFNSVPVDIISLCKSLSITVFNDDSLSSNESGKIEYDANNDSFKISVNKNEPPLRKIFTIAHELGHYFCDYEFLKENKTLTEKRALFRNGCFDEKEIRANEFAAELLMPRDVFILKWNEFEGSLSKMSDFFKVSTQAIGVRASNLMGVIF